MKGWDVRMKKILIVLLVICTLFTTTVYASSVELESMTTDELIELRNQIVQEINNRLGFDESKIYIGDYVVGEDIKAGDYIIVFEKNDNVERETGGGYISLYTNQEDYDRRKSCFSQSYYFGEECYIKLKDGMVMCISYSSGTIKPASKPAWAP